MAPKNYLEQAKTNLDRGEIESAVQNLIDHIDGNFYDPAALMMLGGCFIAKGHPGVAVALTKQAIDIKRRNGEQFPEALNNLGVCFKAENMDEQAREMWKLALEAETIPAERAKILSNLAGLEIHSGTPDKAIAAYDLALAEDPSWSQIKFERGMALLEAGRWREGWEGFEEGFAAGKRPIRNYNGIPIWDGTPNQTVIVWGEQGVGDEILFASCLPDMIRACKKVIFDCHPRLVELFKRSFPTVEIYGTRKTLSKLDWVDGVEADAAICVASLMKFFRNEDSDWPGKPFLEAPAAWPSRPFPKGDYVLIDKRRPRIGISWIGGTKKTRQDLRSMPLMDWVPILQAVDADFYSLQYTPDAAKEVCELEEATGFHVKHYPGWVQCPSYDKTASFVASMDLVITVSTAVHHLANSLGIPTWTLCSSKPSWRYTEHAHRFYHTTNRQFRQRPGDTWAPVIDEIAAAVKETFAPVRIYGHAS